MNPPNILMIVADDLGYNDTSALNPQGLHTPHLAKLAREGVRFTRHYADATCTPSRVAMLTGRYAERSGFRPVGTEIPAEYSTLAERLSAAGYRTYLTGKWHAGEARLQARPLAKGFDEWFGFLNQFELNAASSDGAHAGRPTYRNPMLRDNDAAPARVEGHLTDILTRHTLQRIADYRRSDQPWFIYHAFFAPHSPVQPAPRYARQFPDTPAGAYEALVTQLDDAIGQLVAAVDSQDTLVVFVSDNGGTNLERDNNFPFYGRKNEVYEGAFRTPLILHWPAQLPPNTVIDEIVMNVDLYPTLLAAAGGMATGTAEPNLDGINLWPLMLGQSPAPARVRGWESFATNVNALNYSFLSADGGWRLASPEGISRQLFDLQRDPGGAQDRGEAEQAVAAELDDAFWQDHWQKSLIDVRESTGEVAAQRLYSGFDTLRSPFRHGFAIGLELGPLPEPPGAYPIVLAGQLGIWELRLLDTGEIEWQLGEATLRDAHFDPHRCNAVVLTGYLQPEAALATRSPRSPLKLYSSGFLRDLEHDATALVPDTRDALAAPTFVNAGGRAVFSNMLLSAFADPYAPRVATEFANYYEAAYRAQTLAVSQVAAMDSVLCNTP